LKEAKRHKDPGGNAAWCRHRLYTCSFQKCRFHNGCAWDSPKEVGDFEEVPEIRWSKEAWIGWVSSNEQ